MNDAYEHGCQDAGKLERSDLAVRYGRILHKDE
jgi:hypothetical protein